ncbi:MAG: hypothetical protein K6D95_05155 [Treponema sp.]|nr:hypothetical protein [Treponema sp.]
MINYKKLFSIVSKSIVVFSIVFCSCKINVTPKPAESRTLSSIAVSGSPNFSVANVFFAGKTASTFALTVTATYSDSSTANVSTSATVTSTVSNTAGNVTVTYTEGGVTKTAEVTGSYYVAASNVLTQTVVDNGTTTIDTNTFQLVKFGDFPQTIA